MAMDSYLSPAGVSLWAGNLAEQLANETAEERRKRLAEEASRRALGPLATTGASRTLGLGSYGSVGTRYGGY